MIDLTVGAATWLLSLAQPMQDFVLDPQRTAPRRETTQFYDCGPISATIRYRFERTNEQREPPERSQRFTLVSLSINRRRVSRADFARVSEIFDQIVLLENIFPSCENGTIDLIVGGVRRLLGSANAIGDTPRIDHWSIRLSRRGLVHIR